MTETPHTPLENCPFCGSPAEFGIVTEGGEANPDYGGHFVQCTNERCHGCMGLRFACGDDPKPELLEAWNTRAIPLPTTANNPETDAHGEMLAALKWIADNYENGMINHVDFRVEAKFRADVALTKAEVTHGIL